MPVGGSGGILPQQNKLQISTDKFMILVHFFIKRLEHWEIRCFFLGNLHFPTCHSRHCLYSITVANVGLSTLEQIHLYCIVKKQLNFKQTVVIWCGC